MENPEVLGVSPGQPEEPQVQPEVQTDQPGVEQPTQDQPALPLESFYQLSVEDRTAIAALPNELRDAAITALDGARVSQENAFNERLEQGRQAQANLETLLADPIIHQ